MNSNNNQTHAPARDFPPSRKMDTTTPINVLIPLFDQCNTLDVNGPLEILGNAALREGAPNAPFNITITAATPVTRAYEFVSIPRDVDFKSATQMIENGEVDVLVMPGGGPDAVGKVLGNGGDGLLDLLTAYLKSQSEKEDRWLISICTGALLVGKVGGFVGLTATTHWASLGTLVKICNAQGGPPTTVVRKRWVDGGVDANGIRVVSSGGISCGLDCMLWFVKEVLGIQSTVDVASMMDYEWNGGAFEGLRPSLAEKEDNKDGLLHGTGWVTRQW